jgi:hypothetical protein
MWSTASIKRSEALTLMKEALLFFEASVIIHPSTQHNIPKYLAHH